ncbi:MAG: PTS cellobiose transporter subunit IIC [Bifidobacteriaceae bacterium]|nr:PTS cellobiose transporter subunit IIC [Bifidobacteriaceae bacterium]
MSSNNKVSNNVVKRWIQEHPNIWEFIAFNVLSNISTISRFMMAWIGTYIFISTLHITQPFSFLIFDYSNENSGGLGGFLTFLIAEIIAQIVNFIVQMKLVFKSNAAVQEAAGKYAILAIIIIVVSLVLPGYIINLCVASGMTTELSATVASLVNTLLAVVVSYPILKFWIMKK